MRSNMAFFSSFVGLSLMILSTTSALTASNEALAPPDATWMIRLDLSRAYASPLGQAMMQRIVQEEPQVNAFLDGFAETIGLDPRTEIGEAVIFVDGFGPAPNPTLLVTLGQSPGNLEGWMLTLPGYESYNLDDGVLLHSFIVESDAHAHHGPHPQTQSQDGNRVWVALPQENGDGDYVLIASFNRERTEAFARRVLTEAPSLAAQPLGDAAFMELSVRDFSQIPIDNDEPGSAILRSLEALALRVGSGEQVTVFLDLQMDSEVRARQIAQLLQGLIAAVQLATIEHVDAQPVADLLSQVVIAPSLDEARVTASLAIDHQVVENAFDVLIEHAEQEHNWNWEHQHEPQPETGDAPAIEDNNR